DLLALEGDEGAHSDDGLAAAVDERAAEVTALQAEVEALREELHTAERERDGLAARTGALSLAVDQKDGSGAIVGARGIRGLVTAPDGIRGLLARVVVVADLDAARAAWPALAKLGATVITRDGDVLTEHVLRGGSGGGRSKLELVAERDAAQEKLVTVTTSIE